MFSKAIYYKEGYKYQLAKEYKYETGITGIYYSDDYIKLNKNGLLIIKEGYAWDGPSGPTIDTKNSMRAALIHDALYQLMRYEVLPHKYREHVDNIFYDILKEDGMSTVRAWLWYKSVRRHAEYASLPKNRKKIIVAPSVEVIGRNLVF